MMEEKQAASKVEGSLRTQTINSVNMEYTLYKCIHLGLRLLKTLLDEVFQNLLCWFIGFGQNKEAKLRSMAMGHGCYTSKSSLTSKQLHRYNTLLNALLILSIPFLSVEQCAAGSDDWLNAHQPLVTWPRWATLPGVSPNIRWETGLNALTDT